MEYKLLKQTVTTDIYSVNNAFYLIIPKIIVDKNIKIVIEKGINSKLNEISNTFTITIARPFSSNYFDGIETLPFKQNLKALINSDLEMAREILKNKQIEYNENVTLSTSFNKFKDWYQFDGDKKNKSEEINESSLNPIDYYEHDNDKINATTKFKNDLLQLREELIERSKEVKGGNESGKKKILSNGKSTLKNFDDGFVNIIFLCLVTLFVTVGTMLAMIYIMR